MSVRLFVGNLSYEVTEADLREYFSAVGPVSYISIPVDRETGKRRGFAFVEFGDSAQAEEAIRRFNNQPFKGRPIAVNEARARESRPPGGGYVRPPSNISGLPPVDSMEPPSRGDRRNRRFGPDADRVVPAARPRESKRHRKSSGKGPYRSGGAANSSAQWTTTRMIGNPTTSKIPLTTKNSTGSRSQTTLSCRPPLLQSGL